MNILYYQLLPVVKPNKNNDADVFVLVNASIGICGLCGCVVTGMGGDPSMVCKDCGEMLLSGRLRTCVVREDQ